jgi:hypothetical protein
MSGLRWPRVGVELMSKKTGPLSATPSARRNKMKKRRIEIRVEAAMK